MNVARPGRLFVATGMFAWGSFGLWRLGTAHFDYFPGPILAIFALEPLLFLIAAYGFLRGFKSARYVVYALLIYEVLLTVLILSFAVPSMRFPILIRLTVVLAITGCVHWITRTPGAVPPPHRRPGREAGLLAAYVLFIVAVVVGMEYIHGPRPIRNLSSPIAIG